jgi:glycosyltransferase involved in cell wall biosynthesis
MGKIRVLEVITGLGAGGAERMLEKTVKGLNKKKFDVFVAALTDGVLRADIEKSCPVYVLNVRSVFDFSNAVKKLRQIILEKNIDVVHSYMFHANMVARFAAKGTKAKVICSVRVKEISRPWHVWFDVWTQRKVKLYTAVSDAVRLFMIEKGVPSAKIRTIPNGIELNKFSKKIDVKKKRASLGVQKGEKVVVSVANLREQKDYPTLLRAVALLKKEFPVRLLIVGDGETRLELERLCVKLNIADCVNFLGFRDDVVDVVKCADVCVLSTFYEGQSNALLEYMAAKRPVVATDIEENQELIVDEKTGLLVPMASPRAFADHIRVVLFDKALSRRLVNNAYKMIQKKYTMSRVIKDTEELYKKCAE